jgi:hypothetical protein
MHIKPAQKHNLQLKHPSNPIQVPHSTSDNKR